MHVVRGVGLLLLGVLTGLVAQQIKRRMLDSFRLAEERDEIVGTFGQHVSPAVAHKLLEKRAALSGSIGSHLRREYTVIGDVVNLASRIEQLNKRFGSQLLISETVWEAVCEDSHAATPMGRVPVKGREAPITVYKVA